MRGNSCVVACVAASISVAPVSAYRFRPPSLLNVGSLEAWLAAVIRTGDGSKGLWWAIGACAAFGFIIGLCVKEHITPPVDPKKEFELPFLRTPIAAALLVPVSVATILLVICNHTSQIADKIVWPGFYFNFWVPWSVLIGILGAMAAHLLNDLERAYEKSTLSVRVGILCCWPLAIIVGALLTTGMIGGGLLLGATFGQNHGCPIFAGWIGMCLSLIVLAFEGDIFWPVYFPMTRLGPA
jgi:hypothetical protein